MNSKLGIIASMFAMVAMCVFTSCEDDVDEVEVQVVNDCPGLGLNIGETCYTGVGNILGVVNDSCFCEVSDTIGDGIFDCPVWELNIGDSCADGTDIDGNFLVEGILDANCNCIEEFDCPGLMGNIGDPCQGGWGIITADCDCVDDSMWDCPDIQMNIGDSCFIAGIPFGVVTIDCECYGPQDYTIEGRWLGIHITVTLLNVTKHIGIHWKLQMQYQELMTIHLKMVY